MRKFAVLAGLVFAMSFGVASIVSRLSDLADRTNNRFGRVGSRLEGLYLTDSELAGQIESLDTHLAESVRISHERRAVLADELRREMSTAVAKTNAAIAEETATRESDVSELAAIGIAIEGRIARLTDVDRRLLERIDALEKRMKAAESRPIPAPVVIEKTVQVPVVVPAPTPVYLYPILPRRCR
jgi:chromosome segregation ATPase